MTTVEKQEADALFEKVRTTINEKRIKLPEPPKTNDGRYIMPSAYREDQQITNSNKTDYHRPQ